MERGAEPGDRVASAANVMAGATAAIHVVPQPVELLAEGVRAVLELPITRMAGRESGQAVVQDGEVVLKPLEIVITRGLGLEGRRRRRGHGEGHEQKKDDGERSLH